MIDVIIPTYNAKDTLAETLASIAYQSIAEKISVCIVDDCSTDNYDEIIDFYKNFFKIKYIKLKRNAGPGVARQKGLEATNGAYVVFIDSDDVFADPLAIEKLYDNILKADYDIAISGFTEETDDEFYPRPPTHIWLHGKIFSRKFIDKNNIVFNDTRANEDCGFNYLCFNCGANTVYFEDSTYIWKNNKKSITRKENKSYTLSSINGYVYNMVWSIEEAYKRNYSIERISETIYKTLVSSYHYYLQHKEVFIKDNIFDTLRPIIKYLDICELTDEIKAEIIRVQLSTCMNGDYAYSVLSPNMTLEQFINALIDNKKELL